MVFGKDMDAWQATGGVNFQEKPASGIIPTIAEVKLIGIAGVGFFMDAYDLFIINMVVPILQFVYFNNKTIPWGLKGGVLKAAANIGNVFGQVSFGFLGDSFGRQFVYGKELIIVIVSVIIMIAVPDSLGGRGVTIWITFFRILMGFGIGGDYPMSATVVSDRANLRRRGALLSVLFSGQGWGGFIGALIAVIVIAAYRHNVKTLGHTHALTGAWRILIGLGLVPAFAVLYFRLTMAESTKFTEARKLQDDPNLIYELEGGSRPNAPHARAVDEVQVKERGLEKENEIISKTALGFKPVGQRSHNGEFFRYFSEFRHLKILIGTCMTWFLVDVAFYGINLNQSFILNAINFTSKDPYTKLMKTALGNLIIIAAGYLPGYYFTAMFVELLGRKFIQILGFAMTAFFLGIAGGKFDVLTKKHNTAGFFVVFAFLQFFFNFGANTTTFIIPAEVFPSRVRATAHGVSAAVGKLGAILASLAFVEVASKIGTNKVLLIFMAVSLAGIPFTLLIPETTGRDADVIDREELLSAAHLKNGNGLPENDAAISP
jgi:MFS transporter, PHS family, inorganic phosphate transporter